MQFDLVSTICGFLGGTAIGAAGMYYAEKYTDQRRRSEYNKERKRAFLHTKRQMPELITAIKADLSKEENRFIREFFVLHDRQVCFGGSQKPRFVYYEDEHANLLGKLDILENENYLTDVTPGNTPMFRMSEDLVELIRKYG
jgi:hypothetical protein